MEQKILDIFDHYSDYAIALSLIVSIMIAILGIIPSFFLTGANLIFFGFWFGILVSFLGEALGAIISFFLYRKGLKKTLTKYLDDYPRLRKMMILNNKKVFFSIITLRLMPFIPSGFITMSAAISRIPLTLFAISSSIGKAPALIIEGYSVYQIIHFSWEGKAILFIVSLLFLLKINSTQR